MDQPTETHLKFNCPTCGEVSRDDVLFLCNTCKQNELVLKDGLYICPSCMLPGENFQCAICDSTEVKMVETKKAIPGDLQSTVVE